MSTKGKSSKCNEKQKNKLTNKKVEFQVLKPAHSYWTLSNEVGISFPHFSDLPANVDWEEFSDEN